MKTSADQIELGDVTFGKIAVAFEVENIGFDAGKYRDRFAVGAFDDLRTSFLVGNDAEIHPSSRGASVVTDVDGAHALLRGNADELQNGMQTTRRLNRVDVKVISYHRKHSNSESTEPRVMSYVIACLSRANSHRVGEGFG